MESGYIAQLRRLLTILLTSSLLCPLSLVYADAIVVPVADSTPAKPEVLLAQHFDDTVNPVDYWISEKLDGVRALWDGKTLRFRSGRTIHAPTWFTSRLPAHPLDGELWMGRGQFERVSGAVRRQDPLDAEWQMISYQIFELPGAPGTFSDRIDTLQTSIARADVPWLKLIKQFRVADRQTLTATLRQVVRDGGEGLMLHRADALWQTGRTDALLKLKLHHDAEATVIAHLPGKGKYTGMCGALLVETADGQRFRLGSGLTDAQRRAPPPIGSRVTYRYRGHTVNGLPRFATFVRIRPDE
jgi:DNA ligase-1